MHTGLELITLSRRTDGHKTQNDEQTQHNISSNKIQPRHLLNYRHQLSITVHKLYSESCSTKLIQTNHTIVTIKMPLVGDGFSLGSSGGGGELGKSLGTT